MEGRRADALLAGHRPTRPSPRRRSRARPRPTSSIVGGGFTGLWAAIQAKEEHPDRDVLLLEQDTIAFGASGRNGGFCDATLTHGLANGIDRFPDEIETIERLAAESFRGIEETVAPVRRSTATGTRTARCSSPVQPHEVAWMREAVTQAARYGQDAVFLDRDEVRAELDSPTYLAGMWKRSGCAMVDPARLAWGLRRAAAELGVRDPRADPTSRTCRGRPRACRSRVRRRAASTRGRVVLATNGFPPLVRSIRRYVVPVYDYVLMTEPLIGRAAGVDRVGAATGLRRQREPLPLLPDERATVASCGAATTRSTTGGTASRPELEQRAGDVRDAWRATSSRRSRSSRGCASRIDGAA